ncbi:MAG: hypothetical protein ACFFBE_16350 [Promethearchaeota archaeon]
MFDRNSYVQGVNVQKIISSIEEHPINIDKFFKIVKSEEIDFSAIYEIRKN